MMIELFPESRIAFERGNKLIRFEWIGILAFQVTKPDGSPGLGIWGIFVDAQGTLLVAPTDKVEVVARLGYDKSLS